jgi:hypothetical protein
MFYMNQQHDTPAPPSEPAWDISFTRMANAVLPKIEAYILDLARRFNAIGLSIDKQVRQMPRGLSIFLSVVGQRGLICIVDMTLVDGMAVRHEPCAWLEMRLLDACGDVVVDGLNIGMEDRTFQETSTAETLISECLDQAGIGVYVSTLAHFDLLQPHARHA